MKYLLICMMLSGCIFQVDTSIELVEKKYPEDTQDMCMNGADEDQDGLVDCADDDCKEWCDAEL